MEDGDEAPELKEVWPPHTDGEGVAKAYVSFRYGSSRLSHALPMRGAGESLCENGPSDQSSRWE